MLTPQVIIIGILIGAVIGILLSMFVKWIEKKLAAPVEQIPDEKNTEKKK